ncbi:MAG: hypothetical protein JW738_07565 [Actinobacteria bacterium]|nr:hypothetical protein [Actinomycetota bacterium]
MGEFTINKERADVLLGQLGEALEDMDDEPMDILICGSMALIMQGLLLGRATTDIDGIGFVIEKEGSVILESPGMQKAFMEARSRVAAANNLPRRWINFQPRTLLDNGLPDGIIDRAVVRNYGEKLRIRLCSRIDMVALKMYAALDPERDVDLKDLMSLGPTKAEARFGADYCFQLGLEKEKVIEVLDVIRHEELAGEFA